MNFILWLVDQSLRLDFRFLRENPWPIRKKIHFLFVKYSIIIKHFIKPFRLSKDFCIFDHKRLYYDTRYGIAGLQGVLVRHMHLLRFMKLPRVKVVLDVGANVGYFSYLIHDLFPKASIHAFEPIPQTFDCLKKNINFPKLASVNNTAITDRNGIQKMVFNKDNCAESYIDASGTIKVKTYSLDSYVHKHHIKAIDILKIDTEGFEDIVLDGARKALSITKYIYMEISVDYGHTYTISQLMSKLYSKVYNYQLVAMRNFANISEGEVPIMDCLFVNTKKLKNK